jgi:Protein of unknown function (DUF3325)
VADALLLSIALSCCICGMAWFALAMKTHWQQVRGAEPLERATARALRAMGSLALFTAFLICLRVDHVSMASLVWVMSLIPAILVVAFTLSWRPLWLSWLVVWVRVPRSFQQ